MRYKNITKGTGLEFQEDEALKNKIVYVVALICENKAITGYRLFNVSLEQLVDIEKGKLIDLMQRGYKICNVRLNPNTGKIESSSRACALRRYTKLNPDGTIFQENIPKVLISKFTSRNGMSTFLVYDNTSCRVDMIDESGITDKYDYVSNLVSIDDDMDTAIIDIMRGEWEKKKSNYSKFRYSLSDNLNLSECAVFAEDGEPNTLEIDNCLWIDNFHHSIIDRVRIDPEVYGVSFEGIRNIKVKALLIDQVEVMEVRSIIDSEIGTLEIKGNTWFTGAELIKNCKIKRVVVDKDVFINDGFLTDSIVGELHIKGKHPNVKKSLRKLKYNSSLRYLYLDKDIDNESYELLSRMAGDNTEILME